MKKLPFHKSEAGFSLVSTIVVLGVVLTLILLGSRASVQMQQSSKMIQASSSYQLQISSFTDFISKSIQTNAAALCGNNPAPLNNIPFTGTIAHFRTTLNAPAVAGFEDVQRRCLTPKFSQNGKLYFCLQIDQDANAGKDAFVGTPHNFVEVGVRMLDKWQREISCSEFISAPIDTVGLDIYYKFYWIPARQPERLLQKSGFYYGIKK